MHAHLHTFMPSSSTYTHAYVNVHAYIHVYINKNLRRRTHWRRLVKNIGGTKTSKSGNN